jgi:hypothetical protein
MTGELKPGGCICYKRRQAFLLRRTLEVTTPAEEAGDGLCQTLPQTGSISTVARWWDTNPRRMYMCKLSKI